jgi:dUTP pyrophosphatase|nr:MAG TPA: dUTPase [Caudoviricetes sp.]
MNKRKVNIIVKGYGKLPLYATSYSAGADLYSANASDIVLQPMERKLIPTGLYLELPEDAEAQIRPRSGLSLKKGIVAILGTIDVDYQGEVGIIVMNMSDEAFIIERGERLAQMVLNGNGGLFQGEWNQVSEFTRESERGDGGFGHTGTK